LDLLEVAGSEVMPLLQVDAPGGGFACGVGWDRLEFRRELSDEIGELVLAPADLFQLLDQGGALPIGLFEEPAEGESEAVRTIARQALREGRNLGQPFLGRDAPRGEALYQTRNLGIGLRIAAIFNV